MLNDVRWQERRVIEAEMPVDAGQGARSGEAI